MKMLVSTTIRGGMNFDSAYAVSDQLIICGTCWNTGRVTWVPRRADDSEVAPNFLAPPPAPADKWGGKNRINGMSFKIVSAFHSFASIPLPFSED
jgi:hypothetical protein